MYLPVSDFSLLSEEAAASQSMFYARTPDGIIADIPRYYKFIINLCVSAGAVIQSNMLCAFHSHDGFMGTDQEWRW